MSISTSQYPLRRVSLHAAAGAVRGGAWSGATFLQSRARVSRAVQAGLGSLPGNRVYSRNVVQSWGCSAEEGAFNLHCHLFHCRKAEGKAAATSELPPEYLTSPLSQQSQVTAVL